ncbi:MAG TPA: SpoIID/LytB domain-containing protein [Candidatus Magasanikbacteria bacterium]|nr:SpoIID/LytB domain-containing protein [Candidatus Magasanikbacteria bacterium]
MFYRKIFFTVLVLAFLLLPVKIFAATPEVVVRDPSAYSARFISQSESDPIVIQAGEKKTVKVKFKNIGNVTWNNSGRYISAYTMEPRNRSSVFADEAWISKHQTAKISDKVAPGGTGELSITLHAPSVIGEYVERFYLAAENYSWVQGGYFFLKIKVVEKKVLADQVVIVPGNSDNSADSTKSSLYQAKRTAVKTKKITLKGGESAKMLVHFTNVGETSWPGYEVRLKNMVSVASGTNVSFADSDWRSENVVLETSNEVVPDGITKIAFGLRAPVKTGHYVASFVLVSNGEEISGAVYDLSVDVTEDAPVGYIPPVFTTGGGSIETSAPKTGVVENIRLDAEPTLRVGIAKSEGTSKIRPVDDDYRVFAGDVEKGILPLGVKADLKYSNGVYTFKAPGLVFSGPDFLRLVPVNNPRAVFRVTNLQRYVKWKGPDNFNEYRGIAELRVTTDESALYLINELGMEDYVAGIAETSNAAPIEYIKALLTAARTYAYCTKEYTTKHDKRNFDVVANTGDQLYLGYVSEKLMPHVAEATIATRGVMVTYQNEIVMTPYYANSNGKTKSWKSVWGGAEKPWLVPVIAKYDKGQPMRGHGVGMSARDAAYRAEKDGESFVQLIQYYYTGTEAQRIYQ